MSADRPHAKLAVDCWRLIRALAAAPIAAEDGGLVDDAAVNLIELACDSAAESQRVALGLPPKGVC
jgi:hypothetical protein